MDDVSRVWKKMVNASVFEYSGLALRFMKNNAKDTDFEFISVDDLYGIEELEKLFDKNGMFVEDKIPFILKYLETGV